MTITHKLRMGCTAAGLALGALALPTDAQACGGFFCDSSQPINQAAERIIFAHNADGTVTAVIQILYEGPAENFAWVLPISTVPSKEKGQDIGIASDVAFQRLQAATNPNYRLTTRFEGNCGPVSNGGASAGGSTSGGIGIAPTPPRGPEGVVVEASGTVGPFEWTAISVTESAEDASDVAVTWLTDNGYDVGPGARGLLRPYLEEGLYLLALRLTKDANTGSIRPIKLTYTAEKPMIPIKLTAVAANADMGVMTWILSSGRAVPSNYNALELNEARINWFNPSSNYNDVVTAAANEAAGQGFVTEFAGASASLGKVVWSDSDEAAWNGFRQSQFSSFADIYQSSRAQWGNWDGYWDAVRRSVELPVEVSEADFQLCPECFASEVKLSPSQFIAELETQVIAPVRDVQKLLDEHAYTTRFYTTMSADEMTVDPAFTFNVKLPDVSNQHTAEQVIQCNPTTGMFNTSWRVHLPQGVTVRGKDNLWPGEDLEQPANARVLRLAETGPGQVLEDNSEVISAKLKTYNASFVSPSADQDPAQLSHGCTAAGHNASSAGLLALSAAGLFMAARRRRRA